MKNICNNKTSILNKMNLKTKKALLKLKTLEERFADITTYRVIDSYVFNETIENIEDASFYYDINIEKDKIKASTYIDLLDYFIKMIRHYFFNMKIDEFLIQDIVESNMDKIKIYLLSNTEIFDTTIPDKKRKELNALIYRILISNFIRNTKYINDIKELLESHNIQIKDIDDYSDEECRTIIELMSDLVFCQRGYNKIDYLFVNIEKKLTERLEARHERTRLKSKTTDDYFIKKAIEHYNQEYHQSIRTYNVRKKYLKYFK